MAGLSAPTFFTVSAVSIFPPGQGLTLRVTATGTAPLFYQWQFNGSNLAGANAASLALTNLSATHAGTYHVVVTNLAGTATSQDANFWFFGDLKYSATQATTTLAGPVGQQFRADYADSLTGGTTNWQLLMNLTLPSSPYLVLDPAVAGKPRCFYRAVPVP